MKPIHCLWMSILIVSFFVAGCKDGTPEKPKVPDKQAEKSGGDAQIKANLAKLNDDDRKAAEAQRFCAVESENPLGTMGTPIKLMVKGEPVFLCCKSCSKRALADEDKTLASVKELKAKNK